MELITDKSMNLLVRAKLAKEYFRGKKRSWRIKL